MSWVTASLGLFSDNTGNSLHTNSHDNGFTLSLYNKRFGQHCAHGSIVIVLWSQWDLIKTIWLSSKFSFLASYILSLNHNAVSWDFHALVECNQITNDELSSVNSHRVD